MEISIKNANSLLSKGEPLIGSAGFAIGVTQADIKVAMDQGLWDQYDNEQKLKYILHNVAARVAGARVYDDEFGKGPDFTFKPTGFLNKGLVLYIAAEVAKELKVPYHQTLHKALSPFGLGMAVGGLFDPPVPQSQIDRLHAANNKNNEIGEFNRDANRFKQPRRILEKRVAPSRRGFWVTT